LGLLCVFVSVVGFVPLSRWLFASRRLFFPPQVPGGSAIKRGDKGKYPHRRTR
jgi:hypothetical protein